MPFYFRKRPGSKSIKANITQRGLRSFTLTTGSKKGKPRFNFNTTRGFSFSFPGSGVMWRQRGYGNSNHQSVIDGRGYDLRTKEGKEQYAKNKANKAIAVASVVAAAGVAWLLDSPHGAWTGYILFWVLCAIQNQKFSIIVWAICIHLFAFIGYGTSLFFDTETLEPALFGAVFGNFLSAYLTRRQSLNFFLTFSVFGVWVFFGEPLLYFSDLLDRALEAKFTGFPKISFNIDASNILFALHAASTISTLLNIYSSVALFFGFYIWGSMLWKTAKRISTDILNLILLRLIGAVVFLMSVAILMVPAMLLTILLKEHYQIPNELSFSNYPIMLFMLIAFSPTLGLIINLNARKAKAQKRSFGISLFQCFLTCFWLPRFIGKAPQETLSDKPHPTAHSQTQPNYKTLKAAAKRNNPQNPKQLSQSTKYLELAAEKIGRRGHDIKLANIVGLGKKKREVLLSTFPDITKIHEKSETEINLLTGLSVKLIARVKLAIVEEQKNSQSAVLAEYLAYVFPLQRRPRNAVAAHFKSYGELYLFCENPDASFVGLNKNDFDKLIQTTLNQSVKDASI
jgi:hypothetical protein